MEKQRKSAIKKILIVLTLVATFSTTAFAESPSDIGGNKNQTAIEYLYNNKVISGYPDGTFKPSNTINRAELLKILVGGKGIQPTVEEYNNCFPDIKEEWFAPFVCYAKNQGWVGGYPDGTFQPGKEVNKAEALKMLINSQGYSLPVAITEKLFDDVDNSTWYAPFVKAAKDRGLLEQTSGKYGSNSAMTRGEISENIYRAMIVNSESLNNFWEFLFKPVTLEGTGTKATDQFDLQEGLAIIKLSHQGGKSNFIVQLLNSETGDIDYLSNEIGDYEGTTALHISKSGKYLLNVQADGEWKVDINQSAATFKKESSTSISGKGELITGLVELSGLKTFTLNHDGKSNFIVTLVDLDGNTVEYLSNEIGIFEGSVAKMMEQGTYFFSINADGNWTIEIK